MVTHARRPSFWWALVLLPTLALAWLAMQASDAYDAVSDAQVRTLVRRGITRARALLKEELTALEAEALAALDTAARIAEQRVPVDGIEAAMIEARRYTRGVGFEPLKRVGWDGDLRLEDASGRGLYPREHVPRDQSPDATATHLTGMDDVFTALSRDADQAFYGEGGLGAARAVWTKARDGFGSASNRARCDVELARLELRAAKQDSAAITAAREVVAELEDRHGADTLRELGRPTVLLWLMAARPDRVYAALMDGMLDRVPLTYEERAHAIDMCRNQARGTLVNHPFSLRVLPGRHHPESPPVSYRTEVAHGAQIELLIAQRELWNTLFHRLRERVEVEGLSFQLALPWRPPAGVEPGTREGEGLWRQQLRVEGMRGSVATLGVTYTGWHGVVGERRTRRILVTVAVGVLFLLTLGGIGFMRRAVRRERAARRLRDDFIANVTHEVRTPLTSVLMHAEMLADDDLAPERKQTYARIVHAEGARLATLVEDMLDFSALERGTRALAVEPVDVVAAARRAAEPFAVLAEREGALLTVDAPDEETSASADPAALSRILANLVGNAWKHGRPSTDGGPGRLRIRVVAADGGVLVEVRDDGPGIPAPERARIFERFGRGRDADAKEGAGLGLALSRELARAMGGELSVHSEGDETVFRLRLMSASEIVGP